MNMMKNSKVQVTIGDNSQFEFTYEGKNWKTNIEFEPYLEIRKKDKYEKYLFSEAGKIDTTYYTTGFSQGYQTVYSCFPFDKEFSFATNITIFVTVLYKKHNDEKNFIFRHICLLITGVNL